MALMTKVYTYLATGIDKSDNEGIGGINIPKTPASKGNIETILSLVFALLGGITLIMIIYGGIKMISSQGDPQGFAKAKNTVIYASIGLAISISAFTIVSFVVGRISP